MPEALVGTLNGVVSLHIKWRGAYLRLMYDPKLVAMGKSISGEAPRLWFLTRYATAISTRRDPCEVRASERCRAVKR